jgi:hypothetical protein
MRPRWWRSSSYPSLSWLPAVIPFAFPLFFGERPQLGQYRKRANRLAVGLFTLRALAGLAIKYLV